jgi:hypothetical protein
MTRSNINSRSGMAIAVLSIALLASLTFIAVERMKTSGGARQQQPSAQTVAFQQAAAKLLGSLPGADQATKDAHLAMWGYLSSTSQDRLPSEAELKQVVAGAPVPYDYEYFFKDLLPRYRAKASPRGSVQDPSILLSLPATGSARSRLYVNQSNASVADLRKSAGLDRAGNRIAFAAAYSSPFKMPAGLTIMDGVVVNPILQRFDGVLLMEPAGRLYITSVGRLQDGMRPLNIRDRLDDYQQFVRRAVESKLSVIQGTLLVDEGRNVVDEKATSRALLRRVIFTTEDGGIHIYDSLKKSQTLGEVAATLLEKYHAHEALNLETGPNNFCLLKDQGTVTDCGQVSQGAVLSNIVVIDF